MNKRLLKNAFTLAEALLCFILMGMIFVATISNFHRKDKYDDLYWQAFNTLYQAGRHMNETMLQEIGETHCSCNTNCLEKEQCYLSECWREGSVCNNQERDEVGGTINIDRDFPGMLFYNKKPQDILQYALNGYSSDEEFCIKLTESINLLPGAFCQSFIAITDNNKTGINSSKGGVNFFEAFPAVKREMVEHQDGTIEYKYIPNNEEGGILPTFIASNGQQFYISTVVTANFSVEGTSISDKYQHLARQSYRFIVADLNGNSKPNTQFEVNNKQPDLVLFAMNSKGEVIPLGLPEFSKEYISALVYYPQDLKEDGSLKYPEIHSEPLSLWDAKIFAWGLESQTGLDKAPYRSPISAAEALSQSPKLYSTAVKCMGNSECGNKNASEGSRYADDLFVNLILQFLFKEEHSTAFYNNLQMSHGKIALSTTPEGEVKETGCKEVLSENDTPTCSIDFEHK